MAEIIKSPEGLAVDIKKTSATLKNTITDEGRQVIVIGDRIYWIAHVIEVRGGSWTPFNEADRTGVGRTGAYQIVQPRISPMGAVWTETTIFSVFPDGSVIIAQSDNSFFAGVYPNPIKDVYDYTSIKKSSILTKTLEARVEMEDTPLGEAPVLRFLTRSYPIIPIRYEEKYSFHERQRNPDLFLRFDKRGQY